MMAGCRWCGPILAPGALDALDTPGRTGADKVPAEHGHRLWMVTTESSVWFFRAPDRATLRALVTGTKGLKPHGRIRCRLATFAHVRMVLDARGREGVA